MQIEDLNTLIRKRAKDQLEIEVRNAMEPFRKVFNKELHQNFNNSDSKTFGYKPDRSYEHWASFLDDFATFVIRQRYEPTVTKAVSDFLKKVEEMHELVEGLDERVGDVESRT